MAIFWDVGKLLSFGLFPKWAMWPCGFSTFNVDCPQEKAEDVAERRKGAERVDGRVAEGEVIGGKRSPF